jgi:hypothetical protein
MLDPLRTRRLYAVSYHDTKVVYWVMSQRGGCMLDPLTRRRLYAGSCHYAAVVRWILSQR